MWTPTCSLDVGDSAGSARLSPITTTCMRAQMEEERFRDTLWGALSEGERLDYVEALLNSHANSPWRWGVGGMDRMLPELKLNLVVLF